MKTQVVHNGKLITSEDYEVCKACATPTGKSGKGEDSLYDGDNGPFCESCFDELNKQREEMLQLYNSVYDAIRKLDAFCVSHDPKLFGCDECPISYGRTYTNDVFCKMSLIRTTAASTPDKRAGCRAREFKNSAAYP